MSVPESWRVGHKTAIPYSVSCDGRSIRKGMWDLSLYLSGRTKKHCQEMHHCISNGISNDCRSHKIRQEKSNTAASLPIRAAPATSYYQIYQNQIKYMNQSQQEKSDKKMVASLPSRSSPLILPAFPCQRSVILQTPRLPPVVTD